MAGHGKPEPAPLRGDRRACGRCGPLDDLPRSLNILFSHGIARIDAPERAERPRRVVRAWVAREPHPIERARRPVCDHSACHRPPFRSPVGPIPLRGRLCALAEARSVGLCKGAARVAVGPDGLHMGNGELPQRQAEPRSGADGHPPEHAGLRTRQGEMRVGLTELGVGRGERHPGRLDLGIDLVDTGRRPAQPPTELGDLHRETGGPSSEVAEPSRRRAMRPRFVPSRPRLLRECLHPQVDDTGAQRMGTRQVPVAPAAP